MPLHLHHAPSTLPLADALGELLAEPLPDPFAEELVVVPARGIERWLTQRLAHRLGIGQAGRADGVCAGVRFITPWSLVSVLIDRDRDDPWSPDRLTWPLLGVIDEVVGEPWCAALARHLGHGLDDAEAELRRGRRYAVAHRLAGLYAAYAVQRPDVLTAWRAGDDTDGAGRDLPPDQVWEAELWRRLLAAVGVEPPDARLDRVVAALEGRERDDLDLPDRLSLFGHTRMSVSEVRLLGALARHRDVHLWLPQPSAALWQRLTGVRAAGVVPRADDESSTLVRHPLLASLGRDARELPRVVAPLLAAPDAVEYEVADPAPLPGTLLGWLQTDLREDAVPDVARREARTLSPTDRSVQVHACHGPARQVEVLRDVLVGLLDDDSTLEPRDIVVMCPDVETYAPLISAAFGLGEGEAPSDGDPAHPAHGLRVRLADRALTSTNALLALAASLVELALGRATASDVLDLAATPLVRARFGFSDDDLERIGRWVAQAGARWGFDAERRARFGMQGFEHNTWRAGIDRVLVGVVMSGDEHARLGRGLPLDDVASSDIDLAGRLGEFVDRLHSCVRALDPGDPDPRGDLRGDLAHSLAGATVRDWTAALALGVRSLTLLEDDDSWQLPQFERELARVAHEGLDGSVGTGGDRGSGSARLRLADVRALLRSRLAGRPTRSNFRTGTLTVATLVPMRSVPHRVVCLLGLDDGVFPRNPTPDGDDVLARRPLTGERDRRSEDRQLLLDAVLAAGETLVVTYSGADEHTGRERPPAVPLGELIDALDLTATGREHGPVRAQVVVRHPLQAHDVRALSPHGLVAADPRPFTYDAGALAGARALLRERTAPPMLLPEELPAAHPRGATGTVQLEQLRDFLVHPVREFVRQRLDVGVPLRFEEVGDAIAIELDALEKWQVGDRLLRALLEGESPDAVMTAELLSGALPPGQLGGRHLHEVVAEAQKLFAGTAELRAGTQRSIDVDVDLGDGRRVVGTVSGIFGTRIVSLGYSRLGPKQRLGSWVDLLAASAGHTDEMFTAHAVGKERAGPKRALAGPLDHRAVDWLRDLVDLREEGLRRPLPLPVKTASAWAEAQRRQMMGDDVSPRQLAGRAWVTDPHNTYGIEGEDADAYHRLVFGDGAPLELLVDAGLETLAERVWAPLLDGAEKVGPL
ncbi:exodeoxyribonuclease V subunit gamma [Nocardioides sp. R-C-SC26]|uniref:exodeoxyribonuclease V subunit gamma n=1 Tax=Nocardioides sp. R-C-SC26 TaxID=2870414 RepID=UPI001E34C5D7|nr:exodeoxyribonuclease V subunit gamma [Nocardioides sp. R-C-SC26]